MTAADMEALGIVQAGDPVLLSAARPFTLPAEAGEAGRIVDLLADALVRIRGTGPFAKGMGIAAPQLGIPRAAALIDTPQTGTVVLLNPEITGESTVTDEQYEGCLSFFGVRGRVPRPLAIAVAYDDLAGNTLDRRFTLAAARLACHETDHLNGLLYTTRMRPGVATIPVAGYHEEGRPWEYPPGPAS